MKSCLEIHISTKVSQDIKAIDCCGTCGLSRGGHYKRSSLYWGFSVFAASKGSFCGPCCRASNLWSHLHTWCGLSQSMYVFHLNMGYEDEKDIAVAIFYPAKRINSEPLLKQLYNKRYAGKTEHIHVEGVFSGGPLRPFVPVGSTGEAKKERNAISMRGENVLRLKMAFFWRPRLHCRWGHEQVIIRLTAGVWLQFDADWICFSSGRKEIGERESKLAAIYKGCLFI